MKFILVLLTALSFSQAFAAPTMKMNFRDEDVVKIIQAYSKASGQKFVVDPGVRGKVSIFIQQPVELDEAFNQLSSALAINGFAISKQGDTMVVKAARNIQRDLIEVSTNLPSLKPERMATWVVSLKNASAQKVMTEMRILSSKDGEILLDERTNNLIISDWTSNLARIAEILKQVDQKVSK